MSATAMTPAAAAGVVTVPAVKMTLSSVKAPTCSAGATVGIVVAVLLIIALAILLPLCLSGSKPNVIAVVPVRTEAKKPQQKQTHAQVQPQTWTAEQAPGRGVIELDEAAGLRVLAGAKGAGPAVVMVYAPWCSACQHTKPGYEQASKETQTVRFLGVDGMKARTLTTRFNVNGYPTIFGVRADGKVVNFPPKTPRGKTQLLDFAAKLQSNTAT